MLVVSEASTRVLLLLQLEKFPSLYRERYVFYYFGVSLGSVGFGVYAGKPPSSSPLLENPDRMAHFPQDVMQAVQNGGNAGRIPYGQLRGYNAMQKQICES